MDRESPDLELVVGGEIYTEALERTMIDYERTHPEIMVTRADAGDVLEQLLNPDRTR